MEIKCTHGQGIHECCYAVDKSELLEADRRIAALEKKCEELRGHVRNLLCFANFCKGLAGPNWKDEAVVAAARRASEER